MDDKAKAQALSEGVARLLRCTQAEAAAIDALLPPHLRCNATTGIAMIAQVQAQLVLEAYPGASPEVVQKVVTVNALTTAREIAALQARRATH